MTRTSRQFQSRRGATLVFVAVSMVALLSMMALAIDGAMLLDARDDAQRAADAAALAGASQFMDFSVDNAVIPARNLAFKYAAKNVIRGSAIDTLTAEKGKANKLTYRSREAYVEIFKSQRRVRVTIRRAVVGTWFARIFGVDALPVGAKATAEASPAGGAPCVKPFAVPDIWREENAAQDVDGDRVWDSDENWMFEPGDNDYYQAYDPQNPNSSQATGYGSELRNPTGVTDDYGRQMIIKAQSPKDALGPGFFYPWRIGDSRGANDYKDNILNCNAQTTFVGTPYDIENGDMVGPTNQAIEELIAEDPGAHWGADPVTGEPAVVGSSYGNWRDSPRVIRVGLFDPHQIADLHGTGSLTITFNNIALLFLEGFEGSGNQAPLISRFLYYAPGTGSPGPTTGALVLNLKLVE